MPRLDCCRPMPYDAGSSLVHNYDCAQGRAGHGLSLEEWTTYKARIREEARTRHPSSLSPKVKPIGHLRLVEDLDYMDAHSDDRDDDGGGYAF